MNEAKGLFRCLTLSTLKVQLTLMFIKGASGGWDSVSGEAQWQPWDGGLEEQHPKRG